MRQFWLFQANPKLYKLVDEVPERLGKGDFWLVKHLHDDLRAGDKVILWQAGEERACMHSGHSSSGSHKRQGKWQRVDIKDRDRINFPISRC